MFFPATKSLSFKYKLIGGAVLPLALIFLANCGSGPTSNQAPEQIAVEPGQEIRNLKSVATVIVSKDNSSPDITVGKITFETSSYCATSVEINGKYHDSGTGTSHVAYVYETKNPLEYTIHASTFDGIENKRSEVLIGESSTMFAYHGELGPYLDYLVPVVINIQERFGNSASLLDVILLGGIDYFSLFQKEKIFSLNESTSRELYDSFNLWYEKNRNVLKSAWPFFSESQLKAAAILNTVSYLWHFGNFERITRDGCAQVNELIDADSADFIYREYEGEAPLYWRTAVGMSDFLNSQIGCCIDHAFLTKALLEEAGFESRRVLIPGHWLAEVSMNSSWYTIDASFGTMINASTESMVQGTKRTVYLFFTPYMDFDSKDHYTPQVYPWGPTFSMAAGLDGGIDKESDFEVILGYYDDPPFANELEQINGR
jgi:hypothetical protein